MVLLKHRDALTMLYLAHTVKSLAHTEQGFAAQVLQPENLATRVGHGIVRPNRELVLLAVASPAVTGARLRHLRAELRVGKHVDPGPRDLILGRNLKSERATLRVELAVRRCRRRARTLRTR